MLRTAVVLVSEDDYRRGESSTLVVTCATTVERGCQQRWSLERRVAEKAVMSFGLRSLMRREFVGTEFLLQEGAIVP